MNVCVCVCVCAVASRSVCTLSLRVWAQSWCWASSWTSEPTSSQNVSRRSFSSALSTGTVRRSQTSRSWKSSVNAAPSASSASQSYKISCFLKHIAPLPPQVWSLLRSTSRFLCGPRVSPPHWMPETSWWTSSKTNWRQTRRGETHTHTHTQGSSGFLLLLVFSFNWLHNLFMWSKCEGTFENRRERIQTSGWDVLLAGIKKCRKNSC